MKRALALLALLAAGTAYSTFVHAEDYGVAGAAMGQRAPLALPTAGSVRTDAGLQELEFLGTVTLVVDELLTSAGANPFTLEGQIESRLTAAGLKVSDVLDLPPESLAVEVAGARDGDVYAGAVVLTVTQPAYLERTSRASGAIYVAANRTYVGSDAFATKAAAVPTAIEASIAAVVDEFIEVWREANPR